MCLRLFRQIQDHVSTYEDKMNIYKMAPTVPTCDHRQNVYPVPLSPHRAAQLTTKWLQRLTDQPKIDIRIFLSVTCQLPSPSMFQVVQHGFAVAIFEQYRISHTLCVLNYKCWFVVLLMLSSPPPPVDTNAL